MTKKQIELPPSYVDAQPPIGDFDSSGASAVPPAVPEALQFAPIMANALIKWDEMFKAGLLLVDANLAQELSTARMGTVEDNDTAEGIHREIALLERLAASKQAQITELSATADQFYGVDPLSMTPRQQMNIIVQRMSGSTALADIRKFSQLSHEAAYKRRFASEALTILNEQSAALREKLAQIQAQEAAAVAAAQAAAAQAEAAAIAQAQAAAEAAAIAQAQAAAEAAAIAQAQAAAEAAAIAQAQAAAEAAAIAQAQAAAEAQLAQAEAQRVEQERRNKERVANTFRADAQTSASQAQILVAAGTIPVVEGAVLTLQAAIRASVAGLAEVLAGTASGLSVGVSALLYSTKLGNGELPDRFALTVPLADLGPLPTIDLHSSAVSHGSAQLPMRIGFKAGNEGQTQVIVIPAGAVAAGVPVIAAQYHAEQNVYSVSIPEIPNRSLIWTPAVVPSDNSTATLPEQLPVPVYEGATFRPIEGRIDTYPEVAEAVFDDYIFIFPADSGIPPLYAVFATPRDFPGTASGNGRPVAGQWLAASSEGEGAPVPSQIAEQLRGKEFSSFRRFREAFWQLVAADTGLAKQFSPQSLGLMKKGYAPKVMEAHAVGKNNKFEIHHVIFISRGGEVYGMDNLRVMTPRRHVEVHAEVKNG